MSKISIAFIISSLGQGGAERQFSHLIKDIDKSKFNVTVLLYAYQEKNFYDEIEKDKEINVLKQKLKHSNVFLKIFEALKIIRKFLKKNEYDIVVTTLFMNNFLVRLIAPIRYKNKIISNVRTSLKMYSKIHVFFEKIQIKKSFLIFNSIKARNDFKKIFNEIDFLRTKVIYNGFNEVDDTYIKKNKLNSFGCLGRLNKEKNIIQAVEVFQEIEEFKDKCNLVIQGHFGNQHSDIVDLINSNNIEIRNKNKNIDLFFNSIDILVLPSIFEGCPNVLFEALLRKKLCIVSKGANSDNFIKNGVNGFVYNGSNNDLRNIMRQVVKISEKKQKTIIKNGYSYAKENFSMNVMINNYEELFKHIYEKNKSSN